MDLNYYKNFCAARDKGNYVIDGIVNENKWNSAKYKVLFVLKETVGYSKCPIFHMKDEMPLWLKTKNKTYTKIGKLAVALDEAFSRNMPLTSEEFRGLDFSKVNLFAALEKCAVIELKKHSGVSIKSNWKDIKNEFIANRELLQKQIDTISPDITIVGSPICWECLTDMNVGLFRDIAGLNSVKRHECGVFAGKVFYYANHPSAWGNGGFSVEKIHRQILEQMRNLTGNR